MERPKHIEFKPISKAQAAFFKCEADWCLYGGAKGGGKTYAELLDAGIVPRMHTAPNGKKTMVRPIDVPDYTAIFVRKTYGEFEKYVIPESKKIYPLFGGVYKGGDKRRWEFPSGASIMFAYLDSQQAAEKLQGIQHTALYVDDAGTMNWRYIEEVSLNTRGNCGLKPIRRLSANPGGVNHPYLRKKFVDKCPPRPDGKPIFYKKFNETHQPMKPGKPFKDSNGMTWQYIPATAFDNPYLIDDYVPSLQNITNPDKRRMLLHGDWTAKCGEFFDWRQDFHVISYKKFMKGFHNKVERGDYMLYRAYDYGTRSPFACLFIARDEHGNSFVFDEIVRKNMTATEQARLCNAIAKAKYGLEPEDFSDNVCDPAYTHAQDAGNQFISPYEYYAQEGIYLSPSINKRVEGAAVITEMLRIHDPGTTHNEYNSGVTRLCFTDNCTYMIETIPALVTVREGHKDYPDDVDTEGDDHGYDALRYYGIKYNPNPVKFQRKAKEGWRDRLAKKRKNGGSYYDWKVA